MTDETGIYSKTLGLPFGYILLRSFQVGIHMQKELFEEIHGLLTQHKKMVLAQVHALIGIKIDAESPVEIAVSIVAELIQTRAAKNGRGKMLS